MDALYPLSGFTVGVIVGLTGVGGGSLLTPLLILAFGVAPATAVGTDLLYAAVTKSAGAYVHARRGNVDWHTTGWLAAGSVPAAGATLWVLHALAASPKAIASILTTTLAWQVSSSDRYRASGSAATRRAGSRSDGCARCSLRCSSWSAQGS